MDVCLHSQGVVCVNDSPEKCDPNPWDDFSALLPLLLCSESVFAGVRQEARASEERGE